jgi:hypothetical protein
VRQLNLVKDAALTLGSSGKITDHNRSPLSISYERIENSIRTQRGGLRTYYRADKRTISCSWELVPETSGDTVDGAWGVNELRNFYLINKGAFNVTITYDTGVTETFLMVFADFSTELVRRWGYANLYNMSLSLEQV